MNINSINKLLKTDKNNDKKVEFSVFPQKINFLLNY
jgi:hypothetical protein